MSIHSKRSRIGQQLTLPTGQGEAAAIEKKLGLVARIKTNMQASRAATDAMIDIERLRIEGQREIVELATKVAVQHTKLAIGNASVDSAGALLVGLNNAMAAADQALWNGATAEGCSHLMNRHENFTAAKSLRTTGAIDDEELEELILLAKADAADNLARSRERAVKSSRALEHLYDATVDAYHRNGNGSDS